MTTPATEKPPTFHYRYGGSTAKRTLKCNGWQALADTMPKEDPHAPNKYADPGTVNHDACEHLHNDDSLDYPQLLDMNIVCNESTLTQDMLDVKVIPAFEALEDVLDEYDIAFTEAEKKVNINQIIGGSVDILGISENGKRMLCADYKFGDGVMVYAKDNDQCTFYSWNAFDEMCKEYPNIEEVINVIIQPSHNREDIVDVEIIPAQALFDFEDRFLAAVKVGEASEPGENLCAGDHCKFCPCAVTCPEKTGQALAALKIDPAELEDMSDIVDALELMADLEDWIPAVKKFVHAQLDLGTDIPGWKLVAKRATRKWVDDEKVATYLKRKLKTANAMNTTVISPTQAEKKAKELDIELDLAKHITAKSSGTNLVRESAKGDPVLSQKALAASLNSIT